MTPTRLRMALALAVFLPAATGLAQQRPSPREQRCPDLACELLTGVPRWTLRALEPKDHWHVLDSDCVLRLERTALVCEQNGERDYEVEFRDILGVVHESESFRPVPGLMGRLNRETFRFGQEAAAATGDTRHLTGAMMTIAAQTAILAPVAWVKTTTNYVHLLVRNEGREVVYSFRLTSANAASFLRALRTVAERDTVRVRFAGGNLPDAVRVAAVQFQQIVTIGPRSFFPGRYLIALVEGDDGFGMVYVFLHGRAGLGTRAVAAPARITPAAEGEPNSISAVFAPEGWWRLVELRWEGRVARLWGTADLEAALAGPQAVSPGPPAANGEDDAVRFRRFLSPGNPPALQSIEDAIRRRPAP